MRQVILTGDQFILVLVLVKLGVMASLTSVLVRSRSFVDALFTPRRTTTSQVGLALSLGLPFSIGVVLRLLLGYEGLDLALPGAFLAGLLGGIAPGLLVGTMVGLPSLLMGEWLAMPALVTAGAAAGMVGGGRLVGEEIWELGPLPPLDIFRVLKSAVVGRRFERKILAISGCLGLTIAYDLLGDRAGQGWLYRLQPSHGWTLVAVWTGTLASIGLAIKVFNEARMDIKLRAQEALLAKARYDALRQQINPHFLFNTLNTISSSVRTNSHAAREMIIKLASILRRVLQPDDDFVPLREEVEFIDSYLDIETARFGRERLIVHKAIDPLALDVSVPSMILQPLVENAILHGLAPALEPGTITIRAERQNGAVTVTIEDDGRGMPAATARAALTRGIGIKNVHERLRVAYGLGSGLRLESTPGKGTTVRIVIPDQRSGSHADQG